MANGTVDLRDSIDRISISWPDIALLPRELGLLSLARPGNPLAGISI